MAKYKTIPNKMIDAAIGRLESMRGIKFDDFLDEVSEDFDDFMYFADLNSEETQKEIFALMCASYFAKDIVSKVLKK